MIADSDEAYLDKARHLLRTPGALASLRARLADRLYTTRLFDTLSYTADLERAYLADWERWSAMGRVSVPKIAPVRMGVQASADIPTLAA